MVAGGLSGKEKTMALRPLNHEQQAIARHIAKTPNWLTHKEVGKRFKKHHNTIGHLRKREDFNELVEKYREEFNPKVEKEEEEKPQLKPLDGAQKAIARYMVTTTENTSNRQLGIKFKRSRTYIANLLKREDFQEYKATLDQMVDASVIDIKQAIINSCAEAFDLLLTTMRTTEDEKSSIKIALEILDRGGYSKQNNEEPRKVLHLHAVEQVKKMSNNELLDNVMGIINVSEA